MTDKSDDLNELESLLGHTRARYESLRHTGELAPPIQSRRAFLKRPAFAIAASTLLVVGLGALVFSGIGGPQPLPQSRLATSLPVSGAAPVAPATGIEAVTFSRARQFSVQFRMPPRPSASNG